ncbi:HigA family addiction module antitoxin [Pseudomonadales bacterium]|nr:HigA family addiction module antitoxin [Pseudomonadales bacterium]
MNEIVRAHRGITAETALKLAQYLNTKAQSWMNLQHHYELKVAEQAMGKEVARIQSITAAV